MNAVYASSVVRIVCKNPAAGLSSAAFRMMRRATRKNVVGWIHGERGDSTSTRRLRCAPSSGMSFGSWRRFASVASSAVGSSLLASASAARARVTSPALTAPSTALPTAFANASPSALFSWRKGEGRGRPASDDDEAESTARRRRRVRTRLMARVRRGRSFSRRTGACPSDGTLRSGRKRLQTVVTFKALHCLGDNAPLRFFG